MSDSRMYLQMVVRGVTGEIAGLQLTVWRDGTSRVCTSKNGGSGSADEYDLYRGLRTMRTYVSGTDLAMNVTQQLLLCLRTNKHYVSS